MWHPMYHMSAYPDSIKQTITSIIAHSVALFSPVTTSIPEALYGKPILKEWLMLQYRSIVGL